MIDLDVNRIRSDFPALTPSSGENPIIYFDNTSATLTPQCVIDAMADAYRSPGNARSGHGYSVQIMFRVKSAREKVRDLIHANNIHEIIFTKNATEGINLVSNTLDFKSGDIVLTTDREHNSNMIPWQVLKGKGVKHNIIRSVNDHLFDIGSFEQALKSGHVKLVSMAFTSIIDGHTIPAKDVVNIAHEHGALVLLDAALTVPYRPVNVKDLDVDFLAFSMHNMCGPAGIGVLFGKEELLEALPPFLVGGGTATETTYDGSSFHHPPGKFEAGSIDYPGIIGAAAAVDYLNAVGLENIQSHCMALTSHLCAELQNLGILSVVCPHNLAQCGRICSFNIEGFNPHDLAIHLEEEANILVRSGMHCAHSWYKARGSPGAVSAVPYIYNTNEEVAILAETLNKLKKELVLENL